MVKPRILFALLVALALAAIANICTVRSLLDETRDAQHLQAWADANRPHSYGIGKALETR
jgi:hypothetical protein